MVFKPILSFRAVPLKNVISDDLETWERISQTLIFLRHGIGRAGVPGIVSGYLWFWRKTCAILRQLSPSDSFRFVLQVFFFYILFCYVFRSNVCYFGIQFMNLGIQTRSLFHQYNFGVVYVNTFPHSFWPLLKGVFFVVFCIWRGTSSGLEHILVFCQKDIIVDTSASDD